jgi:glycosyltransferase involved in cell wall biosynthesis
VITVLPVFREECWHSMDLCADMLIRNSPHGTNLNLGLPPFKKILGFLPSKTAKNFDRLYNRWMVYPGKLEKLRSNPGFFHIVDHSYSHLANYLPNGRVGVYCHDLDAFQCILAPGKEYRPEWFRRMMSRVFEGFKKARIVFCSTEFTRNKLIKIGMWDSEMIKVVPYGIADEFTSVGQVEPGEYILHVGSCIPRKRIDVLIDTFSEISKGFKNLRLIQAGGFFSKEQQNQICRLNLGAKIEQRQNLTREDLARLYRGTRCLLVTSDSEGFGLPVIEGLACGAPVVASDIPTLREAGGKNVTFCQPGKVIEFVKVISNQLLTNMDKHNLPSSKFLRSDFNWKSHSKMIVDSYSKIS